MELERILRCQGFGSRAQCRALVLSGRICVNGVLCTNPSADFETPGLFFSVDKELWTFRASAYLALNKPAHFECSHKPKFYPSVYSLLPAPLLCRGVQAVGRLDEDTTGLLLLSDDGQFIHHYTSPKKKVAKVYDVSLKHPVDSLQIDALQAGVLLHDEIKAVMACACDVVGERHIRLTVTEGKYHLVKRMVAAAGNRVVGLQRMAIGGFQLPDDLLPGSWVWLEKKDLELLSSTDKTGIA